MHLTPSPRVVMKWTPLERERKTNKYLEEISREGNKRQQMDMGTGNVMDIRHTNMAFSDDGFMR